MLLAALGVFREPEAEPDWLAILTIDALRSIHGDTQHTAELRQNWGRSSFTCRVPLSRCRVICVLGVFLIPPRVLT